GVDLVVGFPNEMSVSGFRKRLNWSLPPSDFVASLDKEELIAAAKRHNLAGKGCFKLSLTDRRTLGWRTSRPGATYVCMDGLVYKEFQNNIDLIYFDSLDSLAALPTHQKVNVLMPAVAKELSSQKCFGYQFGGISLNKGFEPDQIMRQMALSDVF